MAVRPRQIAEDAAVFLAVAGGVTAGAVVAHIAAPAASAGLTLLLAGLATGMCFIVAEQSWMRWRLVGDAIAGRLCVAFTVYGGVVVPLATTQVDGPGGTLGQVLGTLAVCVVLLSTATAPAVDSGRRLVRPVVVLVLAVVGTLVVVDSRPVAGTSLADLQVDGYPLLEVVTTVTVVAAAGITTAVGLNRRRRTLTRCGIALALVVVAPAVAAGPAPTVAPLIAAAVHVGALLPIVPTAVADSRIAIRTVGRANSTLRERWLDAVAQVESVTRGDRERRHELRSALLALEGASDQLRRDIDGLGRPCDADLAAALATELGRLHELVAGAPPSSPAAFVLRDAITPTVVARRACGQRIEVDVPELLVVAGHPSALAETLGNLLTNADVHAPGSTVVIRTIDEPGAPVRLLVEDDGPAPGAAPAAWRATDHESDGVHGIGLAIAGRLVRDDGGRLTVHRRGEGRGTTVAVDLPRAHARTNRAAEEPWTSTAS